MGIPGLLQQLSSITNTVHIREYRGLTVGIDAYGWIHRASRQCAYELCTGRETSRHLEFVLGLVKVLEEHDVRCIFVFDGKQLPIKNELQKVRSSSTSRHLERGKQALEGGDIREAYRSFAKGIFVTPDMAYEFIKVLQERDHKCIVAPYEADAQLAFLSKEGLVDAVITEDSDALPYGCKRVLFKFNQDGTAEEIQLRNIGACTSLDFIDWNHSMFVDMCILTGCDYAPSIHGVGIKTAYTVVAMRLPLQKMFDKLKAKGHTLPPDFDLRFKQAKLTFRHQRVYDPREKRTVHLYKLSDSTSSTSSTFDFLGPYVADYVAEKVARGLVHPCTFEPYEKSVVPVEKEPESVTSPGPIVPEEIAPPETNVVPATDQDLIPDPTLIGTKDLVSTKDNNIDKRNEHKEKEGEEAIHGGGGLPQGNEKDSESLFTAEEASQETVVAAVDDTPSPPLSLPRPDPAVTTTSTTSESPLIQPEGAASSRMSTSYAHSNGAESRDHAIANGDGNGNGNANGAISSARTAVSSDGYRSALVSDQVMTLQRRKRKRNFQFPPSPDRSQERISPSNPVKKLLRSQMAVSSSNVGHYGADNNHRRENGRRRNDRRQRTRTQGLRRTEYGNSFSTSSSNSASPPTPRYVKGKKRGLGKGEEAEWFWDNRLDLRS